MEPAQLYVLIPLTLIICALVWRYIDVVERAEKMYIPRVPGPDASLAEYWHLDTAEPDGEAWEDCPCCGCPTLDTASPQPACDMCHWVHDPSAAPEALRQARENFVAHGTVTALDDLEEWQIPAPGERVSAARRAIMATCEAAREGTMDPESAWAAIREQLSVLDEEEGKRTAAFERDFFEE